MIPWRGLLALTVAWGGVIILLHLALEVLSQ